jgi:hypothetical protein
MIAPRDLSSCIITTPLVSKQELHCPSRVGGAAYLLALRGQFPDIPLVPTGGVTLDNMARRDYAAIGALAKQFLAVARQARGV